MRILLVILVPSLFLNIGFIIKTWWMSQYDLETFNCKDMSYALAPVFCFLGFDTKIIYGHDNLSGHCWLSVDGLYFDATTLWFNSEDGYHVDFVDKYPFGYYDELREEK